MSERHMIELAMVDAINKAWGHLANGTYSVFGYHAARWVNYNRLLKPHERHEDPFLELVEVARGKGAPVKKKEKDRV